MKISYENEKPAAYCTCIPETEENTILCLREEPGGHETKHSTVVGMHVGFRRSDQV